MDILYHAGEKFLLRTLPGLGQVTAEQENRSATFGITKRGLNRNKKKQVCIMTKRVLFCLKLLAETAASLAPSELRIATVCTTEFESKLKKLFLGAFS